MRSGLVAVGAAFAVIAAAGAAALFVIPVEAPPTTDTSTTVWTAGPFATNQSSVRAPASGASSLTLEWQSDLPVSVEVYAVASCASAAAPCADLTLLYNATDEPTGSFSPAGTPHFPYVFVWSNPTGASGSVTLVADTTLTGAASLTALSQILIALGVVTLGAVAAVVLFLGFFLRGGVYRGPAPLVSRHADDAEEIAREPRPPAH